MGDLREVIRNLAQRGRVCFEVRHILSGGKDLGRSENIIENAGEFRTVVWGGQEEH